MTDLIASLLFGKTQKIGDGKHLENTGYGCDDGCNRSDGDGAGDLQPRQ